jgi:Zn finger protein HypA/HybF involved in hydrogenase expression
MSIKKPSAAENAGEMDAKLRNCLCCQHAFESSWAGERICPKCKNSSAWRTGVPRNKTSLPKR